MNDSALVHFLNYALAFETAYFTNRFEVLEPYFTEDAISEIHSTQFPGKCEGRKAVLLAFRDSCNKIDRRFDRREPRFTIPPKIIDGGVYFKFIITYYRDGLPPLNLEGEEWDYFRDNRIERHVEKFSDKNEIVEFLTNYSEQLLPANQAVSQHPVLI